MQERGSVFTTCVFVFKHSEWDIFVYKTAFAVAEMPEDVESTHYSFQARNGTTSVLDGVVLTEDGKETFQVFVSPLLCPH